MNGLEPIFWWIFNNAKTTVMHLCSSTWSVLACLHSSAGRQHRYQSKQFADVEFLVDFESYVDHAYLSSVYAEKYILLSIVKDEKKRIKTCLLFKGELCCQFSRRRREYVHVAGLVYGS